MSASVIRIVAAVCLQGGHLLTVRKQGTERFMLPGGKPEQGEAPLETLRRELAEELGVAVEGRSLFWGSFTAPAANEAGFEVAAELYRVELQGRVMPAAEIAEISWVDPARPGGIMLAPLLARHVLPLLVAEIGA
ncbi:NUDIX hydrolase [Radicibacter daui]|uniref:NUDIX hydrolase n=1 Tax=Radicibacter daui TaxID=3064829 RepID=UPI004046EDCE